MKETEKETAKVMEVLLKTMAEDYNTNAMGYSEKNVDEIFIQKIKTEFENKNVKSIGRELSKINQGIIATFSKNIKIIEYFKTFELVEQNFRRFFEKIEGNFACADKTNFIMKSIFLKLLDDKDIILDYNQEYTYGLPKKIFNTEDKIMDFYESIQNLSYGEPVKYIKYCQTELEI